MLYRFDARHWSGELLQSGTRTSKNTFFLAVRLTAVFCIPLMREKFGWAREIEFCGGLQDQEDVGPGQLTRLNRQSARGTVCACYLM